MPDIQHHPIQGRRSLRRLAAVLLGILLTGLTILAAEIGMRITMGDEPFQRLPKFIFSSELLPLKAASEKMPLTPWFHEPLPSPRPSYSWKKQRTSVNMKPEFYAFEQKIGGLKPFPDASSDVERKAADGSLIYSVNYSFDNFGRRRIPTISKKHRALFLGCSYTMGQGVQADETFAAIFDRNQQNYTSEIFAFLAWSPTVLVRAIESSLGPPASPPENSDIAVFTLFDHHLMRVTGSSDIASERWLETLNWFDGKKFAGQFRYQRPFTFHFYRLIDFAKKHSLFFNQVLPDLPVYNLSHLEHLADLVEQLKMTTAQRLGVRKFYVMIFPGQFAGTSVGTMMRPLLEKRGIAVIDWSRIQLEHFTPTPRLPFDGHPTKETHLLIGEALAKTL